MDKDKKVSIAVCGKFHYTNYVKYIEQAGMLERFYYSHKISTDAKMLGIDKKHAVNAFLKEYLAVLHEKVLGQKSKMKFMTFYHDLWQFNCLLYFSNSAIFHTLNHGTSIKLLNKYRSAGAITMGEPVNSHPLYMNELLTQEHERLGIKENIVLHKTQERIIKETQLFDYLLTPSNFVKDSYIKYGFPKDKIFNLPFGVDVNKFRSYGNSENKDNVFRVIYVAQIIPRKAHIDLLEAWKQLNLPNSELVFIGSVADNMLPVLKKYDGIYKYAGILSHDKIIDYLNRSSVFVMPSVEEGCSYAPLEAMACGVPVILSTNTGTGELVTEGKEGFIVPIRQAERIAEKLLALYNDREMAREMGANARILAENSLDWRKYSQYLIQIYTDILERNG